MTGKHAMLGIRDGILCKGEDMLDVGGGSVEGGRGKGNVS